MKFDFIIGNPPYQDDVENKGDRPNPVYDKFMDSVFEIAALSSTSMGDDTLTEF